jgi:thiol-disulfide isomerase/thioredoxin
VLLVSVLAALLVGGYRAWADGRFRGTHRVRGADLGPTGHTDPTDPTGRTDPTDPTGRTDPTGQADRTDPAGPGGAPVPATALALRELGHDLGERATLLQFSSAFCAPCRAARRTLGDVAALVPGVVHVEIDAEHHLELVRRLGILRTPTTLVLDASGRETTRASGAPRREQVLAALGESVS